MAFNKVAFHADAWDLNECFGIMPNLILKSLRGQLSSYNNKNFSYTPRGHLKSAGEEKFSFDHSKLGPGIRTSANHATIPQDGVDAFGKIITELIDSKQIRSTYDSLGQTTSRDTSSFEWDPWGRLTKVTNPNYTWKASYDAFGRRLKTTYTSGWGLFPQHTLSFYDPQYEFQEIGLQSGQNTFWKIYGPSSCELILDNKENSVGLLNDALGNLIAVLTPNDISWKKELPSAYGPLTPLPIPSSLLSYAHSLTWQGKQQDPTGLIHFGARYYDPPSGRFLSQDPISYPISLNLYSYANGDPINFRDPDGRFHSPFYQPIKEVVLDTLANPRVQGGFRAGTGLSEMGGGALMLKNLNPAGFGMIFLGTDNVLTGGYELITGRPTNSVTYQLLELSGLPPKWAGFTEGVVNIYAVTKTIALELAESLKPILTLPPKAPVSVGSQVVETTKKTSRNRFTPDINTTGPHTVFRRDPVTGKVTHYETYKPQTNPLDPKPWESVVRFDGVGKGHTNKILQELVETPHVHDPLYPGGIRTPYAWEIPGG